MAEQIDTQKANKTLIIAGGIIAILIAGLLTNGFGLFSKGPTGGAGGVGSIPLEIGNSPVLGNANAPVTVYIFSDFSCPFCSAAAGYNEQVQKELKGRDANWQPAIPNIIKDYVDSGKVKLVFKYFPGHGAGGAAHLVSLALNNQGLFWKFHDLAFANQADTGSMSKMKDLAKQLGADMSLLEQDLKNNDYQAQLKEDTNMGNANGVSGTPSFFINGRKLEGAQSYSEFKMIIDGELS